MSKGNQEFVDTQFGVGGLLIFTGGFLLISIHLSFLLSGQLSERDFFYGWISPVLLLAVLAYVRHWIRQNAGGKVTLRLAGWLFTGVLVFGGSGVLVILYQQSLGGVFVRPVYSVLGWATGGAVIGLIVGIYDVERRISMAETVDALTRAERLTEQLRVYNRVLRHDVRTAANIAMGHADLILESADSPEPSAEVITKQMERMTRLTEQSRKIVNLHTTDSEADHTLDFTNEIEQAVGVIQSEYPDIEIRTDLPDTKVTTTNHSLLIAFNQLLRNAVEHNTNPTPNVEVVLHQDNEYLTLSIEDNGPGTPDSEIEILDKGFETQLEHSDGIGLWLVKWIVDDLDGDLSFEQGRTEGSVVTISVPRSKEQLSLAR